MALYETLGMDFERRVPDVYGENPYGAGLPFPAVLPENRMTKAETRAATVREEAEDASEMAPEETNGKRSEPLSDCAVDTDASEKPEKRRKAVCK